MAYTIEDVFVAVGQNGSDGHGKLEVHQHKADGTLVTKYYLGNTTWGFDYGTADLAFSDDASPKSTVLRMGSFFGSVGPVSGGHSLLQPIGSDPSDPFIGRLTGGGYTFRSMRFVSGPFTWIGAQDNWAETAFMTKYITWDVSDPDYPNVPQATVTLPDIAGGGFRGVHGFVFEDDEDHAIVTGATSDPTTGIDLSSGRLGRVKTSDSSFTTFGQIWDTDDYIGQLYHIEKLPDDTFLVAGYKQEIADHTSGTPEYPQSSIVANVFHVDTDGTLIEEWLVGDSTRMLHAMALDPNGTHFWTAEYKGIAGGSGTAPTPVYKVAIATGVVADTWDVDSRNVLSIRVGPNYYDPDAGDTPPFVTRAKSWSSVFERGALADRPEPRDTMEFYWAEDEAGGTLYRSFLDEWLKITGVGTGSVGGVATLAATLGAGNDAGLSQIKNMSPATDAGDAVTLGQLESIDGGSP